MARWIDRWVFLGAVAPMAALLLIGLWQSRIYALDTIAGFARYMSVVAVLAVGVGICRPLNRYMYDRYRPWIYASDYQVWKRYKAVALLPWIVALLICGAGGALLVLAKNQGLWPWRP
jgi:hypothetical protein